MHDAHDAIRQRLFQYLQRRLPAHAVEDAVQDVFLRVMYAGADTTNEHYLLRTCRSVVADHYRRASRQLPTTPLDQAATATMPATPFSAAAIARGLATLPHHLRTTATLAGSGYTVREIARITHNSPTTTHRRLMLARARLRDELEDIHATPMPQTS